MLRVLLENLEDEDGSTRALVFGVLTEMLKQVYTKLYNTVPVGNIIGTVSYSTAHMVVGGGG